MDYSLSTKRTRKYLYEIGSPTDEIIVNLKGIDCKYHIFTNVIMSNSRKLIGFIYFKYTKTLNAAESVIGVEKGNIMPAKENTDIIQRKYKAMENYWEKGELPTQGKKKDPPIATELTMIDITQMNTEATTINMPITTIVLEQNVSLIEQNKEMCSYLMKQNQHLLEENKQLKDKPISITNNIEKVETNIDNKTFNINVFLNEDCKNAITMVDFVNSLKIEDSDLFCAKERGLVEAITNIFERGLKNCDINTRPVHCTDTKRETLHIKDGEGWVRESGSESTHMKSAIKRISNKKIRKLKEYIKDKPEFSNVTSPKYEDALQMMRHVWGAAEDSEKTEKRVLKNIAKSVYINGQTLQ
jgi:hypothetical protein